MKPVSLDNVVSTYRFYAPLYDRVFGAILDPGRSAMLALVTKLAPESVLEVGVGTGLTLARYPATAHFTGIDISEEMLDIARGRAAAMPERQIRLSRMDAEKTSFADGEFACVTIPYVLSVTPDPDLLVAEIRRVCRKGGTILILNHFSGSRFWWLLEQGVRSLAAKIGFRSDFDFKEQILRHDWEVVSVKKVNFLGLSKLVEIRNV
jgi:phosphatidylethanolamine/phosphatidyl-N-methylethanolamine N-methyltransferase